MSLSGHKLYEPKAIGALWIRRELAWHPVTMGGGQERGRRPGTENVAGIVGFGEACEWAARERPVESERLRALRDSLQEGLLEAVPGS